MIQLVWLTLLAIHTGAAAVWWWLMPGGFPSSSGAFFVDQLAPPILVAALLAALLARGRLSQAILPPVLAAIPLFWMAFGISSRIVFPESFSSLWNLPFLGGAALAGLWARQFRHRLRPWWALALAAAIVGWEFPISQHAPEPSTRPTGVAFGAAPSGSSDHKLIRLSRDAQLRPADGRVVVRRGKLVLNVEPMLSFADRSPDGCWTALAHPEKNVATVRTLVARIHDGARSTLFYKDEDASVLDVSEQGGAIALDSRSRISRPIFSHDNSFAELTVQGHHQLSVAFSPVPDKHIEAAPATAPARFAYLDASGIFHLAKADQQKRGPYTELGAGRLGKGEPLVLTLFDDDKPVFRVSLDDFAAQASTDLSPTAGSGIPMNVISLVRGGDAESAPVLITFSLAATTVGRGTQTVGYAAGVYRDRITVTLAPSPERDQRTARSSSPSASRQ